MCSLCRQNWEPILCLKHQCLRHLRVVTAYPVPEASLCLLHVHVLTAYPVSEASLSLRHLRVLTAYPVPEASLSLRHLRVFTQTFTPPLKFYCVIFSAEIWTQNEQTG
jgi:hypothetical protein